MKKRLYVSGKSPSTAVNALVASIYHKILNYMELVQKLLDDIFHDDEIIVDAWFDDGNHVNHRLYYMNPGNFFFQIDYEYGGYIDEKTWLELIIHDIHDPNITKIITILKQEFDEDFNKQGMDFDVLEFMQRRINYVETIPLDTWRLMFI